MKKLSLLLSVAMSLGVTCAGTRPKLSGITVDASASPIRVNYTLDKPAVVTFAVLTNGVPVGYEWTATGWRGDVFRLVDAGPHSFSWKPYHKELLATAFSSGNAKIRVKAWAPDAPPDYVVFDLTHGCSATYFEHADQIVGGVTNVACKFEKLVMRKIPAALETFRMGAPLGEKGRTQYEVSTLVTLTNDYYLGVFELTSGQYDRLCGKSGSGGQCRLASGNRVGRALCQADGRLLSRHLLADGGAVCVLDERYDLVVVSGQGGLVLQLRAGIGVAGERT